MGHLGWLVHHNGRLRAVPSLLFDRHTSWPVFSVALAVFGVGNGIVLTSVNVAIQAMSKAEDCAMAASMYGFMRSVGMPLGVAVSPFSFSPLNLTQSRCGCGALTQPRSCQGTSSRTPWPVG